MVGTVACPFRFVHQRLGVMVRKSHTPCRSGFPSKSRDGSDRVCAMAEVTHKPRTASVAPTGQAPLVHTILLLAQSYPSGDAQTYGTFPSIVESTSRPGRVVPTKMAGWSDAPSGGA